MSACPSAESGCISKYAFTRGSAFSQLEVFRSCLARSSLPAAFAPASLASVVWLVPGVAEAWAMVAPAEIRSNATTGRYTGHHCQELHRKKRWRDGNDIRVSGNVLPGTAPYSSETGRTRIPVLNRRGQPKNRLPAPRVEGLCHRPAYHSKRAPTWPSRLPLTPVTLPKYWPPIFPVFGEPQ